MNFRVGIVLVVGACTPRPLLVPEGGGQLALASEGGVSLVADATAWGGRWGVEESLTPIAVDIRNGSKRRIIVRAQDMTLTDDAGRTYEVFPLGAQPKAVAPKKETPEPDQRVSPEELPDEPEVLPPAPPAPKKQTPASRPTDGWVYVAPSPVGACTVYDDLQGDVVFAVNAPSRGGGGGGSNAPSRGGGGYSGGHSGGYRAPAPTYRAPAPNYSAPNRFSTPGYRTNSPGTRYRGYGGSRVYVGPGWGYGYGNGYGGYYGGGFYSTFGYGGFGYGGAFWDPFWGPYWGPRYGYGFYLYRPWAYSRPGDDVLSGMIRVALLDTTLAPAGNTRGFVFFQHALDQANVVTLRWTPRDADTNEAIGTLQTVFRVKRGS